MRTLDPAVFPTTGFDFAPPDRTPLPDRHDTVAPDPGRQLSFADAAASVPVPDRAFASARLDRLDATAWIEYVPGWLTGADTLCTALDTTVPFSAHSRRIAGRIVPEPRRTAGWWAHAPAFDLPDTVHDLRTLLTARYHLDFDHVGLARYRNGRDSVAWHGDRVGDRDPWAIVAVLSLGATRRFLLRPAGGGTARRFDLHSGDLVVMGACQRHWQHCVPKTTAAVGVRLSVQFRHTAAASAGRPPKA